MKFRIKTVIIINITRLVIDVFPSDSLNFVSTVRLPVVKRSITNPVILIIRTVFIINLF